MGNDSKKEQLEVKMADYLDDLRLEDEVSYDTYSDLLDKMQEMLDEAYKLGKKEGSKK